MDVVASTRHHTDLFERAIWQAILLGSPSQLIASNNFLLQRAWMWSTFYTVPIFQIREQILERSIRGCCKIHEYSQKKKSILAVYFGLHRPQHHRYIYIYTNVRVLCYVCVNPCIVHQNPVLLYYRYLIGALLLMFFILFSSPG